MNRRLVWAVSLIVFLIGAAAAGLRMVFPSRFDSVRWRAADSPSAFSSRRDMIRDVNRLIGDREIDSRTSAMQQLGSPQSGDIQSDIWLYDLGPDTNASAPGPHQWLELKFDPSDKLISHRVKQETPEPKDPASGG